MATANLRIRKNGGALISGTTDVAAEDEITLTATSFAGWRSARWWIVDYPPGFACPSGWSTDASSGRYYYDMSATDGVEPPAITMPTSAEVAAGQWGKWLFDLLVNGSVSATVRCGVKIPSPNLGLNGLAFSEEAEFGGEQRAYVGEWNEDLRAVDDAALAAGSAPADATFLVNSSNGTLTNEVVIGSVGTTLAFASTSTIPCSFSRTDSATNTAVDARTLIALSSSSAANGFGVSDLYRAEGAGGTAVDVGRLAFTFTDITGSSEDTKFAVQVRTGGSALANAFEVTGTSAKLGAIADGTAGYVAIDTSGNLSRGTGGSGAPADATYLTTSSNGTLTNEVVIGSIGTTLGFASTSTIPASFTRDDSTTNASIDVEKTTATSSGTATTGFGPGHLYQAEQAGGSTVDIGRSAYRWTTATTLSEASEWIVQLRHAGDGLSTKLTLSGAGRLTVADATLSSLGTGYVYATSGVLSVGATQPAPSDAAFLTNGAVSGLSNEVDITNIGTSLAFTSSSTVPVLIQRNAIGSSDLNGLLLDNTTSSGTSEQRPPIFSQGGYGHKTGGGGSQVKCYANRRVRLTDGSSNPDVEVVEQYDIDGSTGTFGTWTTNLPGISGTGLYLNSTIVLGGASNGVRGSGGGNPGLAFTGGWDVQVKAPSTDVVLQTNSTDRVRIANAGNQTYSLPAAGIWRREYGTAATRYVDFASVVFTSDSSAGYETALSYTLPDNCVAEIVVYAAAINTSTGDAAGYAKRRTVKRFAGGSATAVGSERDIGADNEDVAGYSLRTGVTGNTVYVEVDSDTAAAKWGIDMEVRITRTTA